MSQSAIDQQINNVYNIVKGISARISDLAFHSIVGLLPGIGGVIKDIANGVNAVLGKIGDIGNAVKGRIGEAVSSIIPSAIQFIQGFIGGIAQDIHWALNNLATAEQFAAGFVGEAAKHVPGLAKAIEGAISGGLGGGILGLLKFLEGQEAQVVDHLLDEILKEKNLLPWQRTMVAGLRGRGAEWQIFALPLLVASFIIGAGEAMAEPMIIGLRQENMEKFQTSVRTPPELVEARLKEVIPLTTFHAEMARNNINPQRADEMLRARFQRLLPEEAAALVFRGRIHQQDAERELLQVGIAPGTTDLKIHAARPILSPDDIRDIYLRGYINEGQHDGLLAQHGFLPDAIKNRKSLYYLIPGPQDLIHMAIRNVFSPEIVERFQLFGDFPPAFEHAAAQQGISRDWALKFWGAHWIVPSNQEGFDMFHRTTLASEDAHHDTFTLSDGTTVQNVIGRSTLQLLLREKDTAPYYRNKITEIAYNPLTRIDVRRMHRVGSLTHAGVQRAYLDLGYSPQNALRLADFVQTLNSQEKKDQFQALINGLSRRILTYYSEGKLDRLDADMALHDLGLSDDEIKFYFAEEDLLVAADEANTISAGVGKLYTGTLITADAAKARLAEAGVPEVAIARLFRKWDLALEFKDLKAEHSQARDLTKSEILSAVREKLMSDSDARPMLQNLGYDPAEVEIELSLAKYQERKQTTQAQIDALKALFVNGVREPLTVSNNLDALGLNTDRRDALLSEWQLQREQRTEKIPQATIRDMVRAQYISKDDALIQLKRHRLSDDDASLLLNFWLEPTPTGGRRRG